MKDFKLVIFDKDGTLIHFDAMWGGWVTELARRLEEETRLLGGNSGAVADELFRALGFDPAAGRVLAHGKLAATPMARLRALTVDVLRGLGLGPAEAEQAVAAAWHVPDPVALARPLTDLPALFGALRARGMQIALATTDDRTPTQAMLAALGVATMVDALVCADDGIPPKPAPDMVFAVCDAVGVPPAQSVVVGDSAADMQMGRAAGAGLVIGVLSGVSAEEALRPDADRVLESVAELLPSIPPGEAALSGAAQELEDLWGELFSGEAARVRKAWMSLTDDECQTILQHLRKMVDDPSYQPQQKESAAAALRLIREIE
jgi:phosphoglycolate phosphatase-like HAD superfamily hydrolase